MRWKTIVCSSAFALSVFAVPASAAPIFGEMNISGSASVSATVINWFPYANAASGTFGVEPPAEGYFDLLPPIYEPYPDVIGTSLDLTAGTVFPVANFLSNITNAANPEYSDLSFTLEGLVIPVLPVCGTPDGSGVAGDQNGESCVAFAGSPFTLTMGANETSTDINFNVFGSFVDLSYGDDGSLNDASGLYTANIADMTPAEIQTQIAGGGSVASSYSAQFVATPVAVPEPVSLSLTGFGLAAVVYRLRRRREQA